MRKSLAFLCLLMVASLVLDEGNALWWRKPKPSGKARNPYYFGKTDLRCLSANGNMRRVKRVAPWRVVFSYSHAWLYYMAGGERLYFEWGINDGSNKGKNSLTAAVGRRPVQAGKCSTKREKLPAGYSSVSMDCLKKCARSYRAKYGQYHSLRNNCYHFANRLVQVLYSNRCHSWCK